MSGTRLHSLRAPAISAGGHTLLLAAHGECGGRRDDAIVHRLAHKIREQKFFGRVEPCFVRGVPKIADIPAELPKEPILVYPLFMSDGYYVKHAIPRALCAGENESRRNITVLRPLGLNPGLPDVIDEHCRQTAQAAGVSVHHAKILLAAHGSAKSPQSRRATEAVARKISSQTNFAGVHCAYLEEAPLLGECLANLAGPLIVVGLFVGEGMHGAGDVPRAIAKSGRRDVFLCAPLSHSEAFEKLVLSDVEAAIA